MTDQDRGPEPCHYDRTRHERVTKRHRDDCTNPATHNGCAPCTAPHCTVCGRGHVDNTNPITCQTCVPAVQEDLDEIRLAYAALSTEALEAGADGRLVAAAPIPGGNAAVLIGPTVRLDMLRTARGYGATEITKAHHPKDPVPPLAVLAQWEDMWRAWHQHPRGARRATIGAAIAYLRDQVPAMAQDTGGGPDWLAFTKQIRGLRAQLERALHDEREPEVGVECFECGDRLVRRFRSRKVCRHNTPARRRLVKAMTNRHTPAELVAALREARRPCAVCAKTGQGGLDDPAAGQSWECPGCRKQYGPGEYATAVRRSLLNDADGWTTVSNASAAAATLTGTQVGERTIRSWMQRGWVASYVTVQANGIPGLRVVFWPDVKREALRMAAGLQHCKHSTPARAWLRVLEAYELEVWDDEVAAAREECGTCSLAVREVRGHAGAVIVA